MRFACGDASGLPSPLSPLSPLRILTESSCNSVLRALYDDEVSLSRQPTLVKVVARGSRPQGADLVARHHALSHQQSPRCGQWSGDLYQCSHHGRRRLDL